MYGELIIGLNMLFNFVILSFANKVVNANTFYGRLIFAAFIGAVPVTFFPNSTIAVIASFFGMTIIAFGKAFEPWKDSAGNGADWGRGCGGIIDGVSIQNSYSERQCDCFTLCSYCLYRPLFHEKEMARCTNGTPPDGFNC